MKLYDFDSWYNGKVTLIYSEVSYTDKEKPIFVNWDDFTESEVTKIKQMQKQLFEEKVRINLEKFKAEFTKRFSKHLMPKEYLEKEKQECANILF